MKLYKCSFGQRSPVKKVNPLAKINLVIVLDPFGYGPIIFKIHEPYKDKLNEAMASKLNPYWPLYKFISTFYHSIFRL